MIPIRLVRIRVFSVVVIIVGLSVTLFLLDGPMNVIQNLITHKIYNGPNKTGPMNVIQNVTTHKIYNGQNKTEFIHIPRKGKQFSDFCNDSLVHPKSENLKRINSYDLPAYDEYIKDLFPSTMSPSIPDTPVFITGFSSNHFLEGLALADNFNSLIKPKYPTFRLHVYDVGLQKEEASRMKWECNCTVERFELEKYPEHDRILKGYGWKPLLMQHAAKRYRYVIWMDACIRFNSNQIDPLLQKIRTHHLVVASGGGSIAMRTLKETFDILGEQPCLYGTIPEVESNFVAIYESDHVRDYIMKPWVKCALYRGCLVSNEDVHAVHPCERPGRYHKCHRFDQSALGIILHRFNHAHANDNIVRQGKYFGCCRDCKQRHNGSLIA